MKIRFRKVGARAKVSVAPKQHVVCARIPAPENWYARSNNVEQDDGGGDGGSIKRPALQQLLRHHQHQRRTGKNCAISQIRHFIAASNRFGDDDIELKANIYQQQDGWNVCRRNLWNASRDRAINTDARMCAPQPYVLRPKTLPRIAQHKQIARKFL